MGSVPRSKEQLPTVGLTLFSLATISLYLEVNDHYSSVLSRETTENRRLMQMSGWSLLATFLVTELDFMRHIFTTVSLPDEMARLHSA